MTKNHYGTFFFINIIITLFLNKKTKNTVKYLLKLWYNSMYKNKIYIFIFTKDFIMKKKDLALEVIKRLEKLETTPYD